MTRFERFLMRLYPLAKRKLVDIDQMPIQLRQVSDAELDELNRQGRGKRRTR